MRQAEIAANRATTEREGYLARYASVRSATELLCKPLAVEDYGLQTMPAVSPAKWHIAHTSWFFETFILLPQVVRYNVFDPAFDHLFNSYYVTHGKPFPRPQRGFLSRPTVQQVYAYRRHVDAAMRQLIDSATAVQWAVIEPLLALGLNHEQQHQELLLTDLKHAFSFNPLRPAYREDLACDWPSEPDEPGWREFAGGLYEIGAQDGHFAYDNEYPRHRCWLEDFVLADRPVNNTEFLAFIDDGGYRDPRWWLSEGWSTVCEQRWQAPLYWEHRDGRWWEFTLGGMRELDLAAPVSHLSYFEADAYASWAGKRLPTEQEWEVAASLHWPAAFARANLRDADYLHPRAPAASAPLRQLVGDVWEWTRSAYSAYPGFRVAAGPVGEYNGKFMSGQIVLRGGSCATPADHLRPSYRNFFYPQDRWQFSGLRLAGDV